MIIPIGVDCGVAEFCRKYNLRHVSLPFDWTVTYNGVSKCIEDNFNSFVEPLTEKRINKYDVYFHHDFSNTSTIDEDKTKYIRRCNRLIHTMETSSEQLVFLRKGHACHHHHEHDGNYSNITSDIDDCEHLNTVLSDKYPTLDYKIIVILVCGDCFHQTEKYVSRSDKVEIYNIASSNADSSIFENCARGIFNV